MARRSIYLRLEARIAADERGGIVHRWEYGQELMSARAGRQRLPKGFIADRLREAENAGIQGLSEREIQYRIRCAEAYPTKAIAARAVRLFGSWTALRDANFPAIVVDQPDVEPEDLDAIGEPDPYADVPLFEIPGFKPVLRINGRKAPLADATVGQAVEYRDMCREMHANFGRTVEQVEASVETMLAGAGGDLDANALDAWRRATGPTGEAPDA